MGVCVYVCVEPVSLILNVERYAIISLGVEGKMIWQIVLLPNIVPPSPPAPAYPLDQIILI